MGNSHGQQKFNRSDSKRYSKKKYKEEIHQDENLLKKREIVTRKEEGLQHLKEHVAAFEAKLDDFTKDVPERNKEIESLLKILAEQRSKDSIEDAKEDAKEDMIEKNKFGETIERIEHIMRQFQTLVHSQQSLKDSFKVVRSEFDKCTKVFEEDMKMSDDMNNIPAHGHLENKKRRHKVKDAKPIREFQHLGINDVEETEQEASHSAKVQILFTHHGNTMRELVEELKKVLTRRIGSVEFIHLNEKSKVDNNMLMIIVYNVTTRVGADARNAVKNIKNPENVALLLVHIGEAHAVANKNSNLLLTEREFVNLQGIFDMSFKTGNGFFQCDINDKSIDGLTSFCKQSPYSERL